MKHSSLFMAELKHSQNPFNTERWSSWSSVSDPENCSALYSAAQVDHFNLWCLMVSAVDQPRVLFDIVTSLIGVPTKSSTKSNSHHALTLHASLALL